LISTGLTSLLCIILGAAVYGQGSGEYTTAVAMEGPPPFPTSTRRKKDYAPRTQDEVDEVQTSTPTQKRPVRKVFKP
jgi:hypothetical protein